MYRENSDLLSHLMLSRFQHIAHMANATAIDYCGVGETCYDLLPIRIRHYHHVNEQSIGVLSLLANSCLIALLMTERNRELRAYSRILLQNCVVDMVYTVALFLTEYVRDCIRFATACRVSLFSY